MSDSARFDTCKQLLMIVFHSATNCVRREISVFVATRVATNGPFWYMVLLPLYVWKNDTAMSEKHPSRVL